MIKSILITSLKLAAIVIWLILLGLIATVVYIAIYTYTYKYTNSNLIAVVTTIIYTIVVGLSFAGEIKKKLRKKNEY